jgi:hypothetical protein
MRPRKVAFQGVSGAGFKTTVQPAASAGMLLARFTCSGKFQGVMAPTTPIGSFHTMRRLAMPKKRCTPRSRSKE